MPKGKFDYYDVPGFVVGKGDQEQTYRFEGTGRGKGAAERWQRLERVRIYLDGVPLAQAIDSITKAAEGLEDTYVDNEALEEYGDLPWVKTTLSGWADVVSGTAEVVHANEEIAAVKRYVQEQYAKSQDVAAQARDKAEAEIKSLAYRYPDLVAQYAPRATASA